MKRGFVFLFFYKPFKSLILSIFIFPLLGVSVFLDSSFSIPFFRFLTFLLFMTSCRLGNYDDVVGGVGDSNHQLNSSDLFLHTVVLYSRYYSNRLDDRRSAVMRLLGDTKKIPDVYTRIMRNTTAGSWTTQWWNGVGVVQLALLVSCEVLAVHTSDFLKSWLEDNSGGHPVTCYLHVIFNVFSNLCQIFVFSYGYMLCENNLLSLLLVLMGQYYRWTSKDLDYRVFLKNRWKLRTTSLKRFIFSGPQPWILFAVKIVCFQYRTCFK